MTLIIRLTQTDPFDPMLSQMLFHEFFVFESKNEITLNNIISTSDQLDFNLLTLCDTASIHSVVYYRCACVSNDVLSNYIFLYIEHRIHHTHNYVLRYAYGDVFRDEISLQMLDHIYHTCGTLLFAFCVWAPWLPWQQQIHVL